MVNVLFFVWSHCQLLSNCHPLLLYRFKLLFCFPLLVFLAWCLQLLSFNKSLGDVFCVLLMTLVLCSCYLRFRVRYCVVGGCWGVFRVLPSALTFLLYRLSMRSQMCAFSFLGMAKPICIVVFLRACDLWCACDLCFLQRVGGFGFWLICWTSRCSV